MIIRRIKDMPVVADNIYIDDNIPPNGGMFFCVFMLDRKKNLVLCCVCHQRE